jgi:hypothetical protein
MADLCATRATIPTLLDALETEVAALRTLAAMAVPRGFAVVSPWVLRAEVERLALTPGELARLAEVPREEVEDWLAGRVMIPAWVLLLVQLSEQLTPSARRKIFRRPSGVVSDAPAKTHPFSRIEDL